eukprot:1161129-Pelagomonas_calceolata.AAC.2
MTRVQPVLQSKGVQTRARVCVCAHACVYGHACTCARAGVDVHCLTGAQPQLNQCKTVSKSDGNMNSCTYVHTTPAACTHTQTAGAVSSRATCDLYIHIGIDPHCTSTLTPSHTYGEEQLSAAPPAACTNTLGGMDRKNMRLATICTGRWQFPSHR